MAKQGAVIKPGEVKYKVADSVRLAHNNLVAAGNNMVQGARLQMGVPDDYRYNPHTGEFVAPPKQEGKK